MTKVLVVTVAAAAILMAARPAFAQEAWAMPGEEPRDPYTVSDANADATPFAGDAMFRAFHGQAGVDRVVAAFLDHAFSDPRTAEIFKPFDRVRLQRVLSEQFCYLLGGPCHYTGRDMVATHRDIGATAANMNTSVEHLQLAMEKEGIPFAIQNRFLAKLAPMKRKIVTQ